VTVEVPASSANLGCGFDALALALDMPLRTTVEVIDRGPTTLTVEGEGAGRLSADRRNRFTMGLRRGLAATGTAGEAEGGAHFRIEMHNQIPLMRGLGSSAAATVAGLVAARVLSGAALADDRLVALATEIEGHADNAAAALLGGFVVVTGGRTVRLDPPAALRAVVFVPQRPLRTAEMRAVLPAAVPFADAVHNVGAASMIVAAMAGGDLSLLAAMNDDRLHEPYRAAVYPELPALLAAAREAGALGAALSGAGSTVLALCDQDGSAAAVAGAFSRTSERLNLPGTARTIGVSSAGARVIAPALPSGDPAVGGDRSHESTSG
jgi:homoserine kinase